MDNSEFKYFEKKAAMLCGVNRRATFQKVRRTHLEKGVDWINKSNQIFYTLPGLEKALHFIGVPKKEARLIIRDVCKEELTPRPEVPDLTDAKEAELTVIGVCTNIGIVIAELDGKRQRVRVTNSVNFARGMKIPARYVKEDLWELTRRCPRTFGRW